MLSNRIRDRDRRARLELLPPPPPPATDGRSWGNERVQAGCRKARSRSHLRSPRPLRSAPYSAREQGNRLATANVTANRCRALRHGQIIKPAPTSLPGLPRLWASKANGRLRRGGVPCERVGRLAFGALEALRRRCLRPARPHPMSWIRSRGDSTAWSLAVEPRWGRQRERALSKMPSSCDGDNNW